MKRLFISLPDPLPESIDSIDWRLPGNLPDRGRVSNTSDLPAADEIWLALPAGRVLLSNIKLSKRALRQLNGALGNALEDKLMLDPSSVHIAMGLPLPSDVHPIAAVEIVWLDQLLAACRNKGIQLAGAIPETLLWIGEDANTAWCARWQGHDGFVRVGAAGGFALDDGNADIPPLALQLALAEARRQDDSPIEITLESEVDVDTAAWSRSLDCTIRRHALRPDPHAPAINLLQGVYAPHRRGSMTRISLWGGGQHAAKYRLAAGLAAAALGIHFLGTVTDWARLSWENRKLRAEMLQVFKDTFPKTQAIVDPRLQMQRQLADLRRARGYSEPGDFLHELTAAGNQLAGVTGLSYASSRLTVTHTNAANEGNLRNKLASQGYQMVAASDEAGNRTINIERSRP